MFSMSFAIQLRRRRGARTARLLRPTCQQSLWLPIVLGILATFSFTRHAAAVEKAPPNETAEVDFAKQVYPVLKRSCFECHGEKEQEAGLRLDQRVATLQSGTIEPGQPEQSELLRRVQLPAGHDQLMPAVGDPLTSQQVDALRRWILQGAAWPEDFEAAMHWSYVAPRRPAPPTAYDTAWVKSPVDSFVLRQLEASDVTPAPRARPDKLLRRVYLDLIGLPPSPAEVEAFRRDPSDRHFREIVDDLLNRPQFGERWAMPWLDLARYADSHGFQRDNLRDVWAYRDWVIQALNDDMPFDQFTIEQIAGDLLPGATESQRIATGFHRCTPTNVEAGSLPEETRIEQVLDRVNTTGAVWLGTTMECCQCHDHKYDPFSIEDYYRLLAFFNSTEKEADRTNPKTPSSIQFQGPKMPLADPQRDAKREALQEQIQQLKQRQTDLRSELVSDVDSWVATLRERIAKSPTTTTLTVEAFQSEGNTDSHKILPDDSVLLVGDDPPATDRYEVRLGSTGGKVSAIRLDVLTDESLPGKGPGRGDPVRRNFVLNDFTIVRQSVGAESTDDEQPLKFVRATADFSQTNWDVGGAIDANAKSGWAIAPQFGKPHWATFILESPIELSPQDRLVATLTQRFGSARTIGRFRISAITGNVEQAAIPKAVAAAAEKEPAEWTEKERNALVDYRTEQHAGYRKFNRQRKQLQEQKDTIAPDTTLVMVELDEPRMSTVFQRGDYRSPGNPVTPGTPAILHPTPDGPPNRLTLARWLVSRDNPLTARVTVNRWWDELFGQGIVKTVEDFGIKGEPPTHPDLLDWLAVELMENGWSMKRLLKSIVTSSTYQQSSDVRSELQETDPENRLLARGPRFRLNAETIRDNALAISGLLSRKMYGPPIRPYQPDGIWSKVGGTAYDYELSADGERHRRGIYVVLKRGSPYPSFTNFDATARLTCTIKRSRTNTPLQALTLLNDPVYVQAAEALAARIRREREGAPLQQQLEYGFELCTARKPNTSELATLTHLARVQSKTDDPLYGVATVLLNLHETITKD